MGHISTYDRNEKIIFSVPFLTIYKTIDRHRSMLKTLLDVDNFSPTYFNNKDIDGIIEDINNLIALSKFEYNVEVLKIFQKNTIKNRKSIYKIQFNPYSV